MTWGPQFFLYILLAIALLYASWGDWKSRDIPNWLNGAIALGAPLYWWAADYGLWPEVAIIVGIAVVLFLVFTIAFVINAMGGGDVKMIGALALWLTPMQTPTMLIVMAISGGVLTVAMLAYHKIAKIPEKPEIPYGIAIAIGGLFVVVNEILTIQPVTP